MRVIVPVVEVGPVRVRMLEALVPVRVRVEPARGQLGVLVQVMPVVVAMAVDVLDRLVDVHVRMTARGAARQSRAARSTKAATCAAAERLAEERDRRARRRRTAQSRTRPARASRRSAVRSAM